MNVTADRSGGPADRAAHLLTHYLRTVWERAGLTWDDDNTSEVEQIVELLAGAAHAPEPADLHGAL